MRFLRQPKKIRHLCEKYTKMIRRKIQSYRKYLMLHRVPFARLPSPNYFSSKLPTAYSSPLIHNSNPKNLRGKWFLPHKTLVQESARNLTTDVVTVLAFQISLQVHSSQPASGFWQPVDTPIHFNNCFPLTFPFFSCFPFHLRYLAVAEKLKLFF